MNQLINSESEYQEATEKLKSLRESQPEKGSEEADELELIEYLIACYERHTAD